MLFNGELVLSYACHSQLWFADKIPLGTRAFGRYPSINPPIHLCTIMHIFIYKGSWGHYVSCIPTCSTCRKFLEEEFHDSPGTTRVEVVLVNAAPSDTRDTAALPVGRGGCHDLVPLKHGELHLVPPKELGQIT